MDRILSLDSGVCSSRSNTHPSSRAYSHDTDLCRRTCTGWDQAWVRVNHETWDGVCVVCCVLSLDGSRHVSVVVWLWDRYEQRVEAPDKRYQYVLFAAEPYETIGFKVPNRQLRIYIYIYICFSTFTHDTRTHKYCA